MNIAVILTKEVDVYVLLNVCQELELRGNKLTSFLAYEYHTPPKLLSLLNSEIRPFSDFGNLIKKFDCALLTNNTFDDAIFINIYTFAYLPNVTRNLTTGADFHFRFCESEKERYKLRSAQLIMEEQIEDIKSLIVDVMEYVNDNLLSVGKFPRIEKYFFKTYKEKMTKSNLSFEKLKEFRFENTARFHASLIFEDITTQIDWSELYEYIINNYDRFAFSKKEFQIYMWDFHLCYNRILIKNIDEMGEVATDQFYAIRAMFDSGYDDELLLMMDKKILCIGPWNYYAGRIYFEKAERLLYFHKKLEAQCFLELSAKHFIEYLNDTINHSFEKYKTDSSNDLATAYHSLYYIYSNTKKYSNEICKLLSEMKKV